MPEIKRTCCFAALILFVAGLLCAPTDTVAQSGKRLSIDHADYSEIVFSKIPSEPDTLYYGGSVVARTQSGTIYCDTAVVAIGKRALLLGSVILSDEEYRLAADDSVIYDLGTGKARAYGAYVELFSLNDSLLAVGTNAYFDRSREYFYMLDRPTVYLNYPDSTNMIEVIGDVVQYDAATEMAEAEGNVKISTGDVNSVSECAVMRPKDRALDLFGSPVVRQKRSRISGRFIALSFGSEAIERVDVVDSAYAEFEEPTDSTEEHFDRSILSGGRIRLGFLAGELAFAVCQTQAYSWYFPYAPEGAERVENEVSGDSILFVITQNELQQVDVIGGAAGRYLSTKIKQEDSSAVTMTDTIDYRASRIRYDLTDGLMSLESGAETQSGTMSLLAHRMAFDTDSMIVEAFAGRLPLDSVLLDTLYLPEMRPSQVPVVLVDASDTLYGDYLEYSIDTEKGRIVTSRSSHETGLFYGKNLYRQSRDVYYMKNARFTTCDLEGFHFAAGDVKLIEGKRLIAKPVVMHIKRLPILAIPFYVFPLEKGRHSGILPFTFGNIEQGERYIRNVGYYWAPSDYWDVQAGLDYYEENSRVNLFSVLKYKKLYSFDGSVSVNYGRKTTYNRAIGSESKFTDWTLKASHSHEISPTFHISGSGQYQSSDTYYLDYSTDQTDRLNRTLISKLNFSKRFSKSVSLSGSFSHEDNLDTEARTDVLPSLTLRVPQLRPFGSGSKDADGNTVRHWYNEWIVNFDSPSLYNYSRRTTSNDTSNIYNQIIDTTFDSTAVVDTLTSDTTWVVDTAFDVLSADTATVRSRREYTRINNGVSLSLPLTVFKYVTFNPSLNYDESWVKIHETDQSREAGIDASDVYRTNRFSASANLSTKVYGTVYPNLFGLIGLRQVITPTVGYSFTPISDRYPDVSSYSGAVRSTRRSQALTLSLDHVYQAKVAQGEQARSLELLSLTHRTSYDFERDTRQWSDLSTTIRSQAIGGISLTGNATHSFYKYGTDDLDFWSPRLVRFSSSATMNVRGQHSPFDEIDAGIPMGADSAQDLQDQYRPQGRQTTGSGWSVNLSYTYSENRSNPASVYRSSSLTLSLDFWLTPQTQVRYNQHYNFIDKKTISNSVSISRQLHCWTGKFSWSPTGSLKGWGFTLQLTGIPEIKIDQNEGSVSSSRFLQSAR